LGHGSSDQTNDGDRSRAQAWPDAPSLSSSSSGPSSGAFLEAWLEYPAAEEGLELFRAVQPGVKLLRGDVLQGRGLIPTIQLFPVPVRDRDGLRLCSQAIPEVFDELEAVFGRKSQDLFPQAIKQGHPIPRLQ
jgi:hypothetical protein